MEVETEDLMAWDDLCKLKGFENMCKNTKLTIAAAEVSGCRAPAAAEASAPKPSAEDDTRSEGLELAIKIESLKANIKDTVLKYQDQSNTLKVCRTRAENHDDKDMIVPFVKGLSAQLSRTTRLLGMLDKMMTTAMDEKLIPKLLELMTSVDSRYENSMKWAVTFNCQDAGTKRQRRK